MSLKIDLAGEEIELMPERGIFWARESLLLISDWHVGKAATFRAAGIGLPDGDLQEEFDRLAAMLGRTAATEVMVLGDFAHARSGLTAGVLAEVGDWISQSGVRVSLVSGNHDRSAGADRIAQAGVTVVGESVDRAPFVLRHEPGEARAGYVLAGHLHPAVWLGEGKAGGLRAPCFWFGKDCGVLPAFGGFTGGKRIDPADGDRVFAVGGGEVVRV